MVEKVDSCRDDLSYLELPNKGLVRRDVVGVN